MYSLILSADPDAWTESHFAIEESRFLEHTDPTVKQRFPAMTPDVIQKLKSFPAIFGHEIGGGPARVGWVTEIRVRQGEIRISYRFDDKITPIDTKHLAALTWEFDLDKNEFYRTHWALKDIDLHRALRDAGLAGPNDPKEEAKASAAPTRREMIDASMRAQHLSHVALDQLMLEIGIEDLKAGREAGSLRERANALATFVVAHPETVTADNVPLGQYIVDRFAPPGEGPFFQVLEEKLVRASPVEPAMPLKRASRPASIFGQPAGERRDDLVAVMMPFSAGFSDVYAAIKAACTAAGLDCQRADDIWNNEVVMQDVYDLIWQAKIVVSDFTGKNPNVFYETGIAHTLDKTVVPIAQEEGDVPFDLRHLRHLKYLNNVEGRKAMTEKLAERLRTLAG